METYLPQHVLEKIFDSTKDPRDLLKLSCVHVTWKNYIGNLNIWKESCSSGDIYPWKYQLIKMKHPFLKHENYRNLTNEQWRDIVTSYFRWCSSLNAGTEKVQSYFNLAQPGTYTSDYDCDALENYLAIGFHSSGLINLYNLQTGEREMEPIVLEDYADDSNTSGKFPASRIEIKIWRTDDGKIILVILMGNNNILFWDVEEKRYYKTSPIFAPRVRKKRYLSGGFDNEIFIVDGNHPRKLTVFQLKLSADDEIIPSEILNINMGNVLSHKYRGLFVKKRKMMIVYEINSLHYNNQPSELATTFVKFSKFLSEPIDINADDENYTTKVFQDVHISTYKVFIPTFKVLMAYNRTSQKFCVAVLQTSRHEQKPSVVEQVHYSLPENLHQERMTSINFFAYLLFITTEQGNIFIYQLQDITNLFDIQFEILPMLKIYLNQVPIKELKMTQIDGIPNLIVPTKNSLIYFLRMI